MTALDGFVVMPNHVHGIITFVGAALAAARRVAQPDGVDDGNLDATIPGLAALRTGASPAPTLGGILGAFKSLADRRCRQAFLATRSDRRFGCLWQRNYHDHVIAGADELGRIRDYIRNNVQTWNDDEHYVPDRRP